MNWVCSLRNQHKTFLKRIQDSKNLEYQWKEGQTMTPTNTNNTYVEKLSKVKITSADNVTVCITNHIIDVTVTRGDKGICSCGKVTRNDCQ